MDGKFLLRKSTGDQSITEPELRDLLQKGQCKAGDFVFNFSAKQWARVGDLPSLASFFSQKPTQSIERKVVYFAVPGSSVLLQGPFSLKEIQQRTQANEICASSWVFVEGDKEWRQVKSVKALADMLPALPKDQPAAAVAPEGGDTPPAFSISSESDEMPPSFSGASAPVGAIVPPQDTGTSSISLVMNIEDAPPKAPIIAPKAPVTFAPTTASAEEPPEREEITMAFDPMGLNLHAERAAPPPTPAAKPSKPPAPLPSLPSAAKASAPPPKPPPRISIDPEDGKPKESGDHFDGVVAEVPTDPIWLIKPAASETVSGPYRFLEVMQLLEEGKLTKNDKISRVGSKAFTKIIQQYEFNVKYSLETVVENGQEKQKIFIRRRHPRVPYMTTVQLTTKTGIFSGNCVNMSGGGILMESPKVDFNLGEIIEIKILPGLIPKPISCKALIIGKIPKIPPAYALKFEELKTEDKEAIEFFIQESLKREMQKKH